MLILCARNKNIIDHPWAIPQDVEIFGHYISIKDFHINNGHHISVKDFQIKILTGMDLLWVFKDILQRGKAYNLP